MDIFTGAMGVKMLYDGYFKIVLDPDVHPERLERLLSLLLKQEVKILMVLPNEGTKIADEGSLLIMDIVVQLENGSIANVECQKNGYAFPGQRAACYSSDLLMRQYRRVRKERADAGKKFSYRDIKNVYTIIFYEKSPAEFATTPDCYIHRSGQVLDSGVQLNLLQKYVFINLDIYFKIHHNNTIENEMDAWLMFLGTDDPNRILKLLDQYLQFEELYRDLYTACRNTERVMSMFSEELKILDRNTVQYMIDEMEEQLKTFRTAEGAPYRLLPLPMPDAIVADGERLPATYANFLIMNEAVLYPTYGQPENDARAREVLREAFPKHEVIGIDCQVLIRQHGSLHCVTMQYPAGVLA